MAAVADVGRREVKIWRTRQLVWTSAHQQQAAVMKSFLPLLPELFFLCCLKCFYPKPVIGTCMDFAFSE